MTPLDYLLQLMRDECQPVEVRLNAAKAAAPFVHPKLASIEVQCDTGTTVVIHDWRGKGESKAQGIADRLLQDRMMSK